MPRATLLTSAVVLGLFHTSAARRVGSFRPFELSGTWQLSLDVRGSDSATRGKEPFTIKGEIALLRTPTYASYQWLTGVNASHFGVFTLEREMFELPPAIRAAVGEHFWDAMAQLHARDSLDIILRPQLIHGSVVLSGRVEGDSIRGSVAVQGYGLQEAGTFVMRRAQTTQR